MPSPSPFVWYELMTTDAPAATRFYSDVIGWQTADAGMPGVAYTLLSAGALQVAGLMALPDEACQAGACPAWSCYVEVDDVDACALRLEQAGGRVHRPPDDIPGVGRFAVVADPHGAIFCLYKDRAGAPPAAPTGGTPGTVGWHELYADDRVSAWDFYSTLFGWTKDSAIDMGEMGSYQLFAAGGAAIGGMMTRPPQMPVASWLVYFNVEAIDAAAARATAAGGQLVNGPMQVPGGSWVVQCLDPQGAMFAMVATGR